MAMTASVKRAWINTADSNISTISSPRSWTSSIDRSDFYGSRKNAAQSSSSFTMRPSVGPRSLMEVSCDQQKDGHSLKVRSTDGGPHLVSLGSGRLSTNITIIPLPQGRVLMGCGGSYIQRQPDVLVQGTGVEPIHCYIETTLSLNKGGSCGGAGMSVLLYPLGEMTSVDGTRINSPVKLTQGSMICVGRSNYFRFNHPEEAERMKTILPTSSRISSVPMSNMMSQDGPGMDNPEYFHMAGVNGGNSAFQPVRSSSPQYIGEYLHPRTLAQYQYDRSDEDYPMTNERQRWHSASPKVFSSNASTVSLPASAVLGGGVGGSRGRSVTPTAPLASVAAPVTVNNSDLAAGHKRSHSVGAGNRGASPSSGGHRNHSLERLVACEEQLEERRRKAQVERLKEQEQEREERARLDEILQLCAEYQRRMDQEQRHSAPIRPPDHSSQSFTPNSTLDESSFHQLAGSKQNGNHKPPPSPAGHNLHPNRIKTNGSLPRNERRVQSPGSGSGRLNSSEDELSGIFTFDSHPASGGTTNSGRSPSRQEMDNPNNPPGSSAKSPYENVCSLPPPVPPHHSPRTRIRTMPPAPPQTHKPVETAKQQQHTYQLITSGVAAEAAKREAGMLEKEIQQILCIVSALKNHVTDVEHQIDEAVREAEMERALLQGELTAQLEKIHQDEKWLDQLAAKDHKLAQELDAYRAEEMANISATKSKMEEIEHQLNKLEDECDGFSGTTDEETALLERVKYQHELLDTERKVFEDLEFRLMEGVAHREAEREELHKEIAGAEMRLLQRKQQLREVEGQQRAAAESARYEAQELTAKRIQLFQQIEQEKAKLHSLQDKLEELFHAGLAAMTITNGHHNYDRGQSNPEYSSDTEESGTDIEQKLAELRQLGHSQDDLNRIERIAGKNRALAHSDDQNHKATATLLEIERNRQMILVQQGTQVLEYERKKVAELKRRVQDQVRQQWEERRTLHHEANGNGVSDRDVNCHSLNSVGSSSGGEESRSSLTGSDAHESDDALATKTGTSASSPAPDGTSSTASAPSASITSILEVKVRHNNKDHHRHPLHHQEHDDDGLDEDDRPLSDASSFGGVVEDASGTTVEVRLRDKQRAQMQQQQYNDHQGASPSALQQQRPLTRYLPIRGDGFDLRQHIETAGHQVELCPHVMLTSTSARGYLHKMGSRFRTWNKRWFVFDRTQRTFLYYSDKTETRKRSGAYFQAIEEVYVDHLQSVRSPNPKLTFCVKTRERTYHLMAPSAEAMRIWVDVIFTGAEGYQQFHV